MEVGERGWSGKGGVEVGWRYLIRTTCTQSPTAEHRASCADHGITGQSERAPCTDLHVTRSARALHTCTPAIAHLQTCTDGSDVPSRTKLDFQCGKSRPTT